MLRIVLTFPAILAACWLLGCERRSAEHRPVADKPLVKSDGRRTGSDLQSPKIAVGKSPTGKSRRSQHDASDDWLPPLRAPDAAPVADPTVSSWIAGVPFTESHALDRIEREVKDALNVRPTLVVWLFDQSRAAGPMRRALAAAASQMHERLANDASAKPRSAITSSGSNDTKSNPLLTAMIAFGGEVNLLTPKPVADAAGLPAADKIAEVADEAQGAAEPIAGRLAYAAVDTAAERFAEYRMRGHEVIFVLVAHSAAPDEAKFKSAVETLNRLAIPVFAIGPAAPFGRLADSITSATRAVEATLGHESLYPERVQLYLPDGQGDAELSDSGYGPFHLERICRATEGRLLRIRPGGAIGWKTDEEGEVSLQLLRKYAPDYVSEEEYRQMISENRASQALHQAAQLPPARVLIAPTYDFRREEEDAMARALSNAQRAPAENQAALARLHETLATGEPDRNKLSSPRWQAAFDLAYGRACAARARNEGYNHMLAVLKHGKAPTKPDSNTWSLKPAVGIAGRSDLDKLAKTATTYLQRVVKEHAGTPWAALAKRELQTPCGWEWTER